MGVIVALSLEKQHKREEKKPPLWFTEFMAEASRKESGRRKEMAVATNLSLQIDRYPRDLLRGFMSVAADNGARNSRSEAFHGGDWTDGDGDDESEIELNLGLSLGGRFGVDKTPGKLKRSSSIVGTMPIFLEHDESSAVAAAGQLWNSTYSTGLTRTTSLPTEMEEERRKRKEMQMLRRLEAKRRRCGKQKNGKISSGGDSDCPMAPLGLSLINHGSSRQGSGDSDGGGRGVSSSSLSEMESKNHKGCSPQERNSQETDRKSGVSGATAAEAERQPARHYPVDRKGKGSASQVEMPCVFTRGEGPNGKRVEGILYKYGKGEEVRIMCVCHGDFLSPADFVKHAGGRDVDHPLRHIVVINTSSLT